MSPRHTLTALRLAAAAAAFGLAGASGAVARSVPDVANQAFIYDPANAAPTLNLTPRPDAPTDQIRIRATPPGEARADWPAIVHFHWVGQDRQDTEDTADLEREFLRTALAR